MLKKTTTPKEKKPSKKLQKIEHGPDHHMQISELAYKYFVDRGGKHGFDREDWLKAEQQIKGK